METIKIYLRTNKALDEQIRLRFRLRDGRDVQLFHKSDIQATQRELSKLTDEGLPKPKCICNETLVTDIKKERDLMHDVYQEMKATGAALSATDFENRMKSAKYPEAVKPVEETLIERFSRYCDEGLRDGVFAEGRHKHYIVLRDKLSRYLTITAQRDIIPMKFTDDMLLKFRQFLFDEYLYVEEWRGLYTKMNERNIPTERRSSNTIAGDMRALRAFFNELEDRDEIVKTPFKKIGKERREAVLKMQFDMPVCLEASEFLKVLNTNVRKELQPVKDAFILQCSFGCRISDYKALSMENVSVSPDGIPYIHYLPIKTKDSQSDNKEVETPILPFALDIIKRTNFNLPILKYVSGARGYNDKIKDLLKECGIERKVAIFSEEKNTNEYIPLFLVGSSKLCRKTFVDMLNKVQIDYYAAGLHQKGSKAVERYTNIGLKERYSLMCAAFNVKSQRVDKNLNVCPSTKDTGRNGRNGQNGQEQ